MMYMLSDQALDQWNALAEREETAAYQVQQPLGTDDAVYCTAMWREKICEWCFQVVDHIEIDRGVVSIALSYFDRYLSKHDVPVKETLFQLVAMTSLYLAVKLHSDAKISAESMSSLSKGRFTANQILKMEIGIINILRWRLNPPTPSIYLEVANPLIEASSMDAETSYQVNELSRYLLELCVCDRFFIDKKPSSVAYASISVAMALVSASSKVRTRFASYDLNKSPSATELCARRIQLVYSQVVSPGDQEDLESPCSSPTTVFAADDL